MPFWTEIVLAIATLVLGAVVNLLIIAQRTKSLTSLQTELRELTLEHYRTVGKLNRLLQRYAAYTGTVNGEE